jgi:hypothetical protein
MYTVNISKNGQLVNSFVFTTINEAITSLLDRANEHSLWVNSDYSYACSEGHKPEMEIEMNLMSL